MLNSKIAIFQQFLDVFKAQGDQIYFWSFACYQASRDTRSSWGMRRTTRWPFSCVVSWDLWCHGCGHWSWEDDFRSKRGS